jgi:4-alpha-glucanotransferase
MQRVRKSGILLHPTSLPGPGGIGSFGSAARHFIDFLHRSGQTLWQVLPLGYTSYGNSPYMCYSAFAGNPLLIDLQQLVEEGDLTAVPLPDGSFGAVDYNRYRQQLGCFTIATFFAAAEPCGMDEFWHFAIRLPSMILLAHGFEGLYLEKAGLIGLEGSLAVNSHA